MRRLLAVLVTVAAACASAPTATTTAPPAPPATTTTTAEPVTTTSTQPPASSTTAVTTTSSTTTVVEAPPILLAWVSGFLPDRFGEAIAAVDGVDAVTVVSAGIADLVASSDADGAEVDVAPEGFRYPLETFAIDPATYGEFLPEAEAALVAELEPGDVLLGATSARLRRLGPGGTLAFGSGVVGTVAAVLDDELVGGAEVVTIAPELLAPGRLTPRYALVRGEIDAAALRAALLQSLGDDLLLQVKTEGDTPLLRHADVVRSQAEIKARFGEFAYRDGPGRRIEIDQAWVEANIVERSLPLLGTFRCHRVFMDLLEEVMVGLESAGLGAVIDRRAFFGCWYPRWISDRRGLSRHAWGAAADVNLGNATDGGNGSPVNAALLGLTEAAGMTSGHLWLQADPGHFEWYEDVSG